MFRKIVTAVIVVPLAIVIVAFAVANRQAVTVSFDPFSSASPAYAATVPLFMLIFVLVILGVVIGGVAAWLRQSKWRRAARQLDADVRALHQELDAIRRRFAAEPAAAPAREPAVLPAVPPPTP
ncbi:MAG: lipopolysaccharide assembly protein LapA domain-containing protein [Pseudolabrys sp.]